MNKKIGEQLDSDIHMEMLKSFTAFIENFSPLLDKAETYHKHVLAENLINPNESNEIKLLCISEIVKTLKTMIPIFCQFAQLENRLEKFYKN